MCDNASCRGVRGIQIPRGRFESTVRLVQAHRAAMCLVNVLVSCCCLGVLLLSWCVVFVLVSCCCLGVLLLSWCLVVVLVSCCCLVVLLLSFLLVFVLLSCTGKAREKGKRILSQLANRRQAPQKISRTDSDSPLTQSSNGNASAPHRTMGDVPLPPTRRSEANESSSVVPTPTIQESPHTRNKQSSMPLLTRMEARKYYNAFHLKTMPTEGELLAESELVRILPSFRMKEIRTSLNTIVTCQTT